MPASPVVAVAEAPSLRAELALDASAFATVRRRAIFDCCKWDPQVGDVSVLAPFPLVLSSGAWGTLARDAEALAAETLAAEGELLQRPELHHLLTLPRRIWQAVRRARTAPAATLARIMRFDFHLTRDGWRISEVNCDVPGGFIEAAGFTRLMQAHYPHLHLAGDPATALERACAMLAPRAAIGLVHATCYSDDRQVMEFLRRRLSAVDVEAHLLSPADVAWRNGIAHRVSGEPLDGIIRFFPAEWLIDLPRSSTWQHYFCGARTPAANPATALLVQSKRFPLVWPMLSTALPAWRRLLPETRDPRDVNWRHDESWLLKPAMGRVGQDILLPGVTEPRIARPLARQARWFSRHWIAQRRFEAIAIATPDGPAYPCIGIYTADGRAAGIYGRLARRPLIDEQARDVAVLIEHKESP